jgi:hypothetical protein
MTGYAVFEPRAGGAALARTFVEVAQELDDANDTIERLGVERDEAVARAEHLQAAFDRRNL